MLALPLVLLLVAGGLPEARAQHVAPVFGTRTVDPTSVRVQSSAHVAEACTDRLSPSLREASGSDIVRVDSFGAVGDGIADDSEAILRAVKSLRRGSTLVFTPGRRYLKTRLIEIDAAHARVWGYGAVVVSAVNDVEAGGAAGSAPIAIRLRGEGSGVFGLTVISNLRVRLPGHPHDAGIQLRGHRQSAVDNRIEHTGIGVLVEGATDFLVASNVVFRTTADGIHVTNHSWGGRVVCNTVRETGDDMIAVVSYGKGDARVGRVVIARNDAAGQYWGRGIAVVGGEDVMIEENVVADTTHGAAVLIASEAGYSTSNVRRVSVLRNDLKRVQTTRPVYNPTQVVRLSEQAAIHIEADPGHAIADVVVAGNVVNGSRTDGVRVAGRACNVKIDANRIRAVGRDEVRRVEQSLDCAAR